MGPVKLSSRRFNHDNKCECCIKGGERSCIRLHDIFVVLRGVSCLYVLDSSSSFRVIPNKTLVVRFCGSTGYIIVRMFAGE